MTKLKRIIAVAFFVFILSLTITANHIIGNEVTYRQVDTLKYEVDFIIYRYCGDLKVRTNFTTPKVICQATGFSKNLTWKIVSIHELKTECDTLGSQCDPPNTSYSGTGYERVILRSTVDFRHTYFEDFVYKGCTSVRFEMDDCCRNSGITSGLASKYIYNYAVLNLDIDGGNTTPVFTSPPMITACCNQPVYYNVGAVDMVEDDSLSYAFAEPLIAFGSTLKYSGNYTYLNPVDCYFPGSLKPPYNNPNANPPIGMYLNGETGDMIFTPVKCNEHTVFVIEVSEWRKDTSTGKMVLVGKTRRDIELKIKQCAGNLPPVILSDTFEYRTCVGKILCITIESDDKVKVPPPPLKKPDQDSVFLSWNRGIPQGKFVVTKDTLESADFCWTPDTSAARSRPYTFIVYADDDHCGAVIKTQRTFQIHVNPTLPNFTIKYDSVNCGTYKINNSLSALQMRDQRFNLKIRGINNTKLNGQFLGAKSVTSTFPEDVLQFRRNGTYELTYEAACGKTIIDTLIIDEFPNIQSFDDLDICFDHGVVDLKMFDTMNAGGTWSCPSDTSLINGKNEFLTDKAGNSGQSKKYLLRYTVGSVGSKCGLVDSFKITVNPLPNVVVRDAYFCQDKKTVNLKDDKIIVLPGGGTLALGRQAWKCVDCGSYKESDIIEDINNAGPGGLQDFVLHIDKKAIPLGSKASDTIHVEFEYRNVFGCFNRDTAAITVTKVPKISFDFFHDLCWDEGIIELKSLSQVRPADGIWKAVDYTGFALAAGLNRALKGDTLNGDTLNTLATPQPAEGSSFTYLMRYFHDRSGCPSYRDTTLTIRGLPIPIIDEIPFSEVHKSFKPFTFCELNREVNMEVNYAGGTWSSNEKGAVLGSDFIPSAVSNYNTPFHIFYDFTDIYGCEGRDSVQVVVHQQHALSISNDTALTWYADNMNLKVKAIYANSSGVIWVPLTGGTVDDRGAPSTTYRFGGSKDTIFRHLLYAQTDENSKNVCPFTSKTMQLWIHPTPCMDVNMEYTLSTKTLTLSPGNENMASYKWEVDGKTYTTKTPSIDLSKASDSLILVKLVATNLIGDSCVSYNKINLNNGSVKDINQTISLYPNPVKNGFTIESKTDLTGAMINIYSSNGKLVKSSRLSDNYVNCEKLSAGMYTIRIETGSHQYFGRFVKE
ncbi:MAG: hypothetical protein ACI9JN_002572 [Bacteroidia bacterium]|jgi:hypothetical protein